MDIESEVQSKEDEVFVYLNRQLKQFGLEGNVISILALDRKNQELSCYGRRIEKEDVLSRLNFNDVNDVLYPEIEQLDSYREGCFTYASAFLIEEKKTYVALVNISVSGTAEVFPYPR
ncbi:hypothetical protein HOA91_04400 [Candidatus Woesearchaeota archaeon]|jgi:hypothetical protein|nr:hypothetical protein [Candidatus Woesearchaeota archaeon]